MCLHLVTNGFWQDANAQRRAGLTYGIRKPHFFVLLCDFRTLFSLLADVSASFFILVDFGAVFLLFSFYPARSGKKKGDLWTYKKRGTVHFQTSGLVLVGFIQKLTCYLMMLTCYLMMSTLETTPVYICSLSSTHVCHSCMNVCMYVCEKNVAFPLSGFQLKLFPSHFLVFILRYRRDLILFASSDGSKARALGVAENAPDLTAKVHSAKHRLSLGTDFNVSYSSCWGYSLINTLKLKGTGHLIIMTAVDWTTSQPSSPAHWRALLVPALYVCISQNSPSRSLISSLNLRRVSD